MHYGQTIELLATRHKLTAWERRALEALMDPTLSAKQIAGRLSYGGERRTEAAIKHAVTRIAEKLEVDPPHRLAIVWRVLETAVGAKC